MKNTLIISILVFFTVNLFAQKKPTIKPPKDPFSGTSIYNPPIVINQSCDLDFVVLPIKVWKAENLIKFEANIRNVGKKHYTKCSGCTAPKISAYTWSTGTTVAEVPIHALKSGQNIKISGSFNWPTNNEFLPPLNINVSNTFEFDTVTDCDMSNNMLTLTGEQIKAQIGN